MPTHGSCVCITEQAVFSSPLDPLPILLYTLQNTVVYCTRKHIQLQQLYIEQANTNSNSIHREYIMSETQQQRHIKVDNTPLTKEEQDDFLRRLLPACQPQEGSPANTFTRSELDDLQRAVGNIKIEGKSTNNESNTTLFASQNKVDIRDVEQAFNPPPTRTRCEESASYNNTSTPTAVSCPQEGDGDNATDDDSSLDWHGAPRLHEDLHLSRVFRETVRTGSFTKPTNGVCPGFLQCNLVVLPQGKIAFDFLLFCQRNPKACPLIEVCDVGSAIPHGVAPGADLRTDLPRYVAGWLAIYLELVVLLWLLVCDFSLIRSTAYFFVRFCCCCYYALQIFHLPQRATRKGSH